MSKVIGVLGDPLIRLTTKTGVNFDDNGFIRLNYGGAEINVGINLSMWKNEVYAISCLPQNNIGTKFKMHLESFGIKTDFISLVRNGRIGLYYLFAPNSIRTGVVTYDRKDTAFWNWSLDNNEIDQVTSTIDHLHVSGITLALKESLRNNVFKLIKALKAKNKTVSLDFNYRASLWTLVEAKRAFLNILPYVDYAFLGEKDLRLTLNVISEFKSDDYSVQLQKAYEALMVKFPNLKVLACTRRDVLSPQDNNLTGFLYANNTFFQSPSFKLHHIIDRIGGGDAFASGVLQGILNNWANKDIINFATANSVLKHTMYGDAYSFSINEINDFLNKSFGDITR